MYMSCGMQQLTAIDIHNFLKFLYLQRIKLIYFIVFINHHN